MEQNNTKAENQKTSSYPTEILLPKSPAVQKSVSITAQKRKSEVQKTIKQSLAQIIFPDKRKYGGLNTTFNTNQEATVEATKQSRISIAKTTFNSTNSVTKNQISQILIESRNELLNNKSNESILRPIRVEPNIKELFYNNPQMDDGFKQYSPLQQQSFQPHLLTPLAAHWEKVGLLTPPSIQFKMASQPKIKIIKQSNTLEWWFSVSPILSYQRLFALEKPEIGYLIRPKQFSRLNSQRLGGQIQLDLQKFITHHLGWRLTGGYTLQQQRFNYEWFTGDFKVVEPRPNQLLIERNALTYSEQKSLHLATLSASVLYKLNLTKHWLPQIGLGGTLGYDLSNQNQLKEINFSLIWQHKKWQLGLNNTYYFSEFIDKQRFLKAIPYNVGITMGWKISDF